MQTAGCYGICAAILRNPNCALKELDFKVFLAVTMIYTGNQVQVVNSNSFTQNF